MEKNSKRITIRMISAVKSTVKLCCLWRNIHYWNFLIKFDNTVAIQNKICPCIIWNSVWSGVAFVFVFNFNKNDSFGTVLLLLTIRFQNQMISIILMILTHIFHSLMLITHARYEMSHYIRYLYGVTLFLFYISSELEKVPHWQKIQFNVCHKTCREKNTHTRNKSFIILQIFKTPIRKSAQAMLKCLCS